MTRQSPARTGASRSPLRQPTIGERTISLRTRRPPIREPTTRPRLPSRPRPPPPPRPPRPPRPRPSPRPPSAAWALEGAPGAAGACSAPIPPQPAPPSRVPRETPAPSRPVPKRAGSSSRSRTLCRILRRAVGRPTCLRRAGRLRASCSSTTRRLNLWTSRQRHCAPLQTPCRRALMGARPWSPVRLSLPGSALRVQGGRPPKSPRCKDSMKEGSKTTGSEMKRVTFPPKRPRPRRWRTSQASTERP
ncbi:MAG: hypothetical protein EA397_08315 [Deltaproteobacteria bacterium]|nr:MAG: hypothetical protein EA397_08315 [Deltaproteobacteria bacterium]